MYAEYYHILYARVYMVGGYIHLRYIYLDVYNIVEATKRNSIYLHRMDIENNFSLRVYHIIIINLLPNNMRPNFFHIVASKK